MLILTPMTFSLLSSCLGVLNVSMSAPKLAVTVSLPLINRNTSQLSVSKLLKVCDVTYLYIAGRIYFKNIHSIERECWHTSQLDSHAMTS